MNFTIFQVNILVKFVTVFFLIRLCSIYFEIPKHLRLLHVNKTGKHNLLNVDESKKNNVAIAVLIDWNIQKDVKKLMNQLLPSIEYLDEMNILFFSDIKVTYSVKDKLKKISKHFLRFIPITFTFPKNFNTSIKSPFPKRSKWGYMHMCRFWFKDIWMNPALKEFKYLLRFDTDSCLVGRNFSIPNNSSLIYMHHYFTFEFRFITDLRQTILRYVAKFRTKPKTPGLFKMIEGGRINCFPMWYNNLEITNIEFMKRPEVRQFMDAIDSTHGQYKYRWGDAPLRFATMALFAPPGTIVQLNFQNNYKHPC